MSDKEREEFIEKYKVTPEQSEEIRKRNKCEKEKAELQKKKAETTDDTSVDQKERSLF